MCCDRSPSPEPVYNADGKRVNTREFRYRKKLEDERHKLVEHATKTIPGFVPPADYRKPTRLQEKVYIPAKEFPEINFIGLLIGPRGKTLKAMESDSGAKISIRGRGSVKEGKSRTDAAANSAQEEDLHCLVMGDTEEKVRKAVKMIEKTIETVSRTCSNKCHPLTVFFIPEQLVCINTRRSERTKTQSTSGIGSIERYIKGRRKPNMFELWCPWPSSIRMH